MYQNGKKITGGSGRITKKNFPTDKKSTTASFKRTTTQFDSMDGYIRWGDSGDDRKDSVSRIFGW